MSERRKYSCTAKRKPLVIDGEAFFPAYDDEMNEKELEKARLEFGETEEIKNSCLQELKRRLCRDEDMKYLIDEFYLLRYLRFKKFDCDEAYKMIKYFYTQKTKHSEYFAIPDTMEHLMHFQSFYYMPYADQEGRIVFMGLFDKWKPEEIGFMEIFTGMAAVTDLVTMSPKAQINGTAWIFDAQHLTARQIAEFLSPIKLLRFFTIFQVHLLGSDLNELHKHINPLILPKSLGGTLDEEDCMITQDIMDNIDFLKYERSFTSPDSCVTWSPRPHFSFK